MRAIVNHYHWKYGYNIYKLGLGYRFGKPKTSKFRQSLEMEFLFPTVLSAGLINPVYL